MTTLYRPVLIESVGQANAMPKGTFIRLSFMSDSWTRLDSPERREPYEADEVPFTALVPIEAEEEVVERSRLCQKDPDVLHRYVTGWQHYTAKEQNR